MIPACPQLINKLRTGARLACNRLVQRPFHDNRIMSHDPAG